MTKPEEKKDDVVDTNTAAAGSKEKEEGMFLSKKEMGELRGIIASSAEKDATIKELSEKVAELSSRTNESLPVEDPTVQVGTEGTLKKTPDGQWIIGMVKKPNGRYVYSERNPGNQNEFILFVDLVVLGKDKPVKTMYKDFIEDYAPEKIVFSRAIRLPAEITADGTREEAAYDSDTGEMKPTGRLVKASVVNDTKKQVVVVLDGKEVIINEEFINA